MKKGRGKPAMRAVHIKHSLLLLVTAVIWGVAFVAQSVGMDYVGPFTFTCARSLIAGVVLLPLLALRRRRGPGQPAASGDRRALWLGGLCCGLFLALASSFQQFGIQFTTVGKAGFITAFYIVLVPVLGLLWGRRCSLAVWIGVAMALAGLYLLCITEGFAVQSGDLMVFICALLFAGHILVIDHFTHRADGVAMACIQFFACGLLCAVPMLIFERPSLAQLCAAWLPVLYAGVLSSGVGYTLQIIGQRDMNPTVASLILSLESVVSVLAGLVLLGQRLSAREWAGCLLMFCAIILAQLPGRRAASSS